MRIRRVLLVGVVLFVVGVALALWGRHGPDAAQFADIRTPRLTRLGDQRVLVVEAAGDPNVVAGGAFKLLFNAYYALDGVSRLGTPPAPRARWSRPETTPKDQWLGEYALPLPETAVVAPPASGANPRTIVTTWHYGDVAEVLHVGPYSTEQPDIERLRRFIDENGYRVIGAHEEEYVKGPGILLAGDPSGYLTIIRLRVERGPLSGPGQ